MTQKAGGPPFGGLLGFRLSKSAQEFLDPKAPASGESAFNELLEGVFLPVCSRGFQRFENRPSGPLGHLSFLGLQSSHLIDGGSGAGRN